MPTFDFSNIIARLARVTLATVRSPITALAILSSGVGVLFASLVNFFDFSYLTQTISGSLGSIRDNAFVNTIFYCINLDAFLDVFSLAWNFFVRFVPFLIGFTISYSLLVLKWKSSLAFRKTLESYLKG